MQLYRLLAIGGLIAALGLTTVLTVKSAERPLFNGSHNARSGALAGF
jgi:hypothetical protein